jgi:hypothetical protein
VISNSPDLFCSAPGGFLFARGFFCGRALPPQ